MKFPTNHTPRHNVIASYFYEGKGGLPFYALSINSFAVGGSEVHIFLWSNSIKWKELSLESPNFFNNKLASDNSLLIIN